MLVAKFTCPSCQATLKPANPIPAGKTVKCPKCATPFEVKGEEPAAAAVPAGAAAPKSGANLDKTRPLPRPVLKAKDTNQGIAKTPELAKDETAKLVAKFTCPSCQATLKPATPVPAGKTVKCPKCATAFQVKAEGENSSEAKPAVAEKKVEAGANGGGGDFDVVPDEPAKPKLIARFHCTHCKAQLKPASPLPAGKTIKCPKCSQSFAVPNEEAPDPKAKAASAAPPASAEPKSAAKPASADYEVVDDAPQEVAQTTCPGCKATLKPAKPVAVGKKMKCPKCALLFAVAAPPKADDEPIVADVEEEGKPAEEEEGGAFSFNFDDPVSPKKMKKPVAKPAADKPKAEEPAEEQETKPRKKKPSDEEEMSASGIWLRVGKTIGISVVGIAALAAAAYFAMNLLPAFVKPSVEWKEFSPPNSRCQVLMPATPVEKPISLEGLPSMHGHRFAAEIPNAGTFSLSFIDLTTKAQEKVFDELYMTERGRLLAATPGSKLGEEANVTASGTDGKECIIDGGAAGTRIARIFLVRSQPFPRLYVLVAEGPRISEKDELSAKFFNSFQITSKEGGPIALLPGGKEPPDKIDPRNPGPTAGAWKPLASIAQGLNPQMAIGKYQIHPPKLYQVSEEKAADFQAWNFQGNEKAYQQVPALIFRLEGEKSPYNVGGPKEAMDRFFKDSDRYLGVLLPQQKETEEGNINGIPFLRRHFITMGETLRGKGFVYLGRDGSQTIIAFAYDSGNEREAIMNLMETVVLTLRKEGPPPDVKPPDVVGKPPDKPKVEAKFTAKERAVLRHAAAVQAVALAADGKTLATAASGDKVARLWETGKTKERAALTGHKGAIQALAFSPDGTVIATASEDKTIKLWDTTTGKENRTLEGHPGPVTTVLFSPDGKFLVSGGQDKTVKVWDLLVGIELFTLEGHAAPVTALAVSRDNNVIASADQSGLVMTWDVGTRKQRDKPFAADAGRVNALAFLGGLNLASGGADHMIKLWDLNAADTKKPVLTGHKQDITCLTSDRDAAQLVSGSKDHAVRIWDVANNGKVLFELTGHQGAITGIAVSGDGKLLATGSADQTAKLWDLSFGP